jgi:hypothetical protein
MWTRFVEADQGITPTIAHVPTGIVHGQATAEAGFEKVPSSVLADPPHAFDCLALV